MSAMASQITSFTIDYSTVYSGLDQRKHQSSASPVVTDLFVRGIHRSPVNFPHKRPVTRTMFPCDDVIMRKTRTPPDIRLLTNWIEPQNTDKQRVLMLGIKGEMSGTVCVTFTWDIYIYIWVVYSFCLFCCLFIIVTWWYIWCIVWQVASKRKYRHVW